MIFDVAIIGSGPANLFAAMELLYQYPESNLKVLVLERARRLNDSRNVANGWFGGSARSTVSMFIDPGFGGEVEDESTIALFIDRLKTYSGGAKLKVSRPKLLKRTLKRLSGVGILAQQPTTVPFSEDKMIRLGDFIYQWLKQHGTVFHKIDISSIHKLSSHHFEIETNNGTFQTKRCFLGAGRGGPEWLRTIDHNLELTSTESEYDLGVRLEFPSQSLHECISKTPYFRFKFGDFRTTVPSVQGSVETEEVGVVKVSNGRTTNSSKNYLANLALFRKFESENPERELYRLVEIVNVLCDGQLLREPVSRFLTGKSVLSPIKEFDSIREGVAKLVNAFPKLGTRCSLYAPEARLNVKRYNLSPGWESSDTEGLYIVGDQSGKTKSFVQAACSGLQAAHDILEKEGY
jgi:uncharacterized protein